MYITRKVFSIAIDENGEERYFSTNEIINEESYLRELMYSGEYLDERLFGRNTKLKKTSGMTGAQIKDAAAGMSKVNIKGRVYYNDNGVWKGQNGQPVRDKFVKIEIEPRIKAKQKKAAGQETAASVTGRFNNPGGDTAQTQLIEARQNMGQSIQKANQAEARQGNQALRALDNDVKNANSAYAATSKGGKVDSRKMAIDQAPQTAQTQGVKKAKKVVEQQVTQGQTPVKIEKPIQERLTKTEAKQIPVQAELERKAEREAAAHLERVKTSATALEKKRLENAQSTANPGMLDKIRKRWAEETEAEAKAQAEKAAAKKAAEEALAKKARRIRNGKIAAGTTALAGLGYMGYRHYKNKKTA